MFSNIHDIKSYLSISQQLLYHARSTNKIRGLLPIPDSTCIFKNQGIAKPASILAKTYLRFQVNILNFNYFHR